MRTSQSAQFHGSDAVFAIIISFMLLELRPLFQSILWGNAHLLLWILLVPFDTSWLGGSSDAAAPVTLYGFPLPMSAIVYFLPQNAIIAADGTESLLTKCNGEPFQWQNLSPALFPCNHFCVRDTHIFLLHLYWCGTVVNNSRSKICTRDQKGTWLKERICFCTCARDRTRTDTALSCQGGLSPPRLPFRHLGKPLLGYARLGLIRPHAGAGICCEISRYKTAY